MTAWKQQLIAEASERATKYLRIEKALIKFDQLSDEDKKEYEFVVKELIDRAELGAQINELNSLREWLTEQFVKIPENTPQKEVLRSVIRETFMRVRNLEQLAWSLDSPMYARQKVIKKLKKDVKKVYEYR